MVQIFLKLEKPLPPTFNLKLRSQVTQLGYNGNKQLKRSTAQVLPLWRCGVLGVSVPGSNLSLGPPHSVV